MTSLRFDQINLVMPDPLAASKFLKALGFDMETDTPWSSYHAPIQVAQGDPPFTADIDSSAFAQYWGGLQQNWAGVVVNLRVESRSAVDAMHSQALQLGATDSKAPHDAFWGSRYALVIAPGPLAIGFMSDRDPAMQSAPEPPEFR